MLTGIVIGVGALFALSLMWLIWEAYTAPLLRQDEDGNWYFEDGD